MTIQKPETASEGSQVTTYRTLTFEKVSETADVVLIDHGPHGVKFSFQAKYVGRPKGEV